MDQQYSIALGRPLAISSIGDCPWIGSCQEDSKRRCLEACTNQFTLLSRQILFDANSSITQTKAFTTQMLRLYDAIPVSMRFEDDWIIKGNSGFANLEAALLHGQVHHLLLMLLRQQRKYAHLAGEKIGRRSSDNFTELFDKTLPASEQILKSCRSILQVFRWFNTYVPRPLIGWAIRQQAMNAAWTMMIETKADKDVEMVQETYDSFVKLDNLGSHSILSEALGRLGTLLAAYRAENTLDVAVLKRQRLTLIKNPELFGTLPFSTWPTTNEISQAKSQQAVLHTSQVRVATGQACPSILSDRTRKHRKSDAQPGSQNKTPEKRSLEKKSTGKQRRMSTTVQKRNSIGLAKEKRQQGPSAEEMPKSPTQSIDIAASNMHIDMLERNLPLSFLTTQKGLSAAPAVLSHTTTTESCATLDCSTFPEMPSSAVGADIHRNMTPFQICASGKHKETSQKYALDMRQNSFLPYSSEPTTVLSVFHPFAQFPSPPQSQGSADSLALSHLYRPVNNHTPLQPQPGRLPQHVTPDPYGHTFHNLLFGQTHTPASTSVQAASDVSNISWQVPYEGFPNTH